MSFECVGLCLIYGEKPDASSTDAATSLTRPEPSTIRQRSGSAAAKASNPCSTREKNAASSTSSRSPPPRAARRARAVSWSHPQKHHPVRLQTVCGPFGQAGQGVGIEAPAVALVSHGAGTEPIANDIAAGRQRGSNHFGHMLGSGRQHQKHLGPGAQSHCGRVENQLADPFARDRPAWLAGEQGSGRLGENGCLGGLAARLSPFEYEEAPPRRQMPAFLAAVDAVLLERAAFLVVPLDSVR